MQNRYVDNCFDGSIIDEVKNINYDAFLAAVLLTNRKVSIYDLNKIAGDLKEKCNIYIYSTFDNFSVDIYCDNNHVILEQEYSEVICNNDRYITVHDYLYSVIESSIMSSSESYIEAAFIIEKVKEFFGLPLKIKPKFIFKNYIPIGARKVKK